MVNNPSRIERNICVIHDLTGYPYSSHLMAPGHGYLCSNSFDDTIATLMQ
jgi:hypothetical protein